MHHMSCTISTRTKPLGENLLMLFPHKNLRFSTLLNQADTYDFLHKNFTNLISTLNCTCFSTLFYNSIQRLGRILARIQLDARMKHTHILAGFLSLFIQTNKQTASKRLWDLREKYFIFSQSIKKTLCTFSKCFLRFATNTKASSL